MFKQVYAFGEYEGAAGTRVRAGALFNAHAGYGFLHEGAVKAGSPHMAGLLGGGFAYRASGYERGYMRRAVDTPHGVLLRLPHYPLRFKAVVPAEGVYQVTVAVRAEDQPVHSLAIYTGRRNLVAHALELRAGETKTVSFLTRVCPYMAAVSSDMLGERAVYVTVFGEPAVLSAVMIRRAEGPTIFVAGDSTLTDQAGFIPYYPAETCGGWAQNLLSLLGGSAAVCNQAHSGLTGTCFREDGHWDIIKDRIRSGDLFLIQFGHNDQKRRSLRADGGYADNLRWYITRARARGAEPLLVTPLARSARDAHGRLHDVLVEYAQACFAVGRELEAPVIDLHGESLRFYGEKGAAQTLSYFMKGDATHTNDFGSMQMALLFAGAARQAGAGVLTRLFTEPLPPAFLPLYSQAVPETPASEPSALRLPFVDIADSPDLPYIEQAGEKGLLDVCVLHLHPAEPLPRAQFIFLLFKALRLAPRSLDHSAYGDVKLTDWECDLIGTAYEEGLIDEATTPGGLFRPDDPLTGGEAVSMIVRALRDGRSPRELTMAACLDEAKGKGLLYEGFEAGRPITRGKIYRLLVGLTGLLPDAGSRAMPAGIEVHPVG